MFPFEVLAGEAEPEQPDIMPPTEIALRRISDQTAGAFVMSMEGHDYNACMRFINDAAMKKAMLPINGY